MNIIDIVKNKIMFLYKTNPNIHVNVNSRYPRRISLQNYPVLIKSVYPNMFIVEDRSDGKAKTYTHQYADVITKEVEIVELSGAIPPNPEIKHTARHIGKKM